MGCGYGVLGTWFAQNKALQGKSVRLVDKDFGGGGLCAAKLKRKIQLNNTEVVFKEFGFKAVGDEKVGYGWSPTYKIKQAKEQHYLYLYDAFETFRPLADVFM